MLDILTKLDGWNYKFPYFVENVPVNTHNYQTLYDSTKEYPEGSILFATIIMSTPDFTLKISTGDVTLHEVNVTGILYGQSPSGYNVPSGLIANVFAPVQQTAIKYPIPVFNPEYAPASGVAFMTSSGFPFKDGIRLEVKVPNPPQTVYQDSVGILNIYDDAEYIASLQKVFAGVK